MARDRVRVLALAVVERPGRGAVLVSEGFDRARNSRFDRLLGGGVEFGERGEEALRRELLEEIGVEIEVLGLAGVVENLFTYEGKPGHEVALVYRARFADPTLYGRERFAGLEDDPVDGTWHPLAGPGSEVPVFPPGALELAGIRPG